MKRIATLSSLLLIIMLLGSSCKKCHVCTALDEDNNAVYNYPEVCATNSDLEAYRERCESEYGPFGFTCSCGPRE